MVTHRQGWLCQEGTGTSVAGLPEREECPSQAEGNTSEGTDGKCALGLSNRSGLIRRGTEGSQGEKGEGDCGTGHFSLEEEENAVGGGEGRHREERQWENPPNLCCLERHSRQQLSLLGTDVCSQPGPRSSGLCLFSFIWKRRVFSRCFFKPFPTLRFCLPLQRWEVFLSFQVTLSNLVF